MPPGHIPLRGNEGRCGWWPPPRRWSPAGGPADHRQRAPSDGLQTGHAERSAGAASRPAPRWARSAGPGPAAESERSGADAFDNRTPGESHLSWRQHSHSSAATQPLLPSAAWVLWASQVIRPRHDILDRRLPHLDQARNSESGTVAFHGHLDGLPDRPLERADGSGQGLPEHPLHCFMQQRVQGTAGVPSTAKMVTIGR